MIKKEVKITLATETDIPRIVSFLKKPEIDQSFVYPLSRRNVSIKKRVRNKFLNGFWLIALHGRRVVGCRGCNGLVDQKNAIVEFSTIAVAPDFRGKGLGTLLLQRAVKIAFERYSPRMMKFDSWSTNDAMEKTALKAGFTKSRVFEDPIKRPPGVQSVEFILDCSNLHIHE